MWKYFSRHKKKVTHKKEIRNLEKILAHREKNSLEQKNISRTEKISRAPEKILVHKGKFSGTDISRAQ